MVALQFQWNIIVQGLHANQTLRRFHFFELNLVPAAAWPFRFQLKLRSSLPFWSRSSKFLINALFVLILRDYSADVCPTPPSVETKQTNKIKSD